MNEQLDEENWDWSRCGVSTAFSRPPRPKLDPSSRAFREMAHAPITRCELEGPCPRSHYLLLSQKWGEESIGRWHRPTPSQPVQRKREGESEIPKSLGNSPGRLGVEPNPVSRTLKLMILEWLNRSKSCRCWRSNMAALLPTGATYMSQAPVATSDRMRSRYYRTSATVW